MLLIMITKWLSHIMWHMIRRIANDYSGKLNSFLIKYKYGIIILISNVSDGITTGYLIWEIFQE